MSLLNELSREWRNWHEGLRKKGSCLPSLALLAGGVGLFAGLTQEAPPMANVSFGLVGLVGAAGLWVPAWLLSDSRLLFRRFARRHGWESEVVENCAQLLYLRPMPEPLEAYTETALQAYQGFCQTAALAVWRERGVSLDAERTAVRGSVRDFLSHVTNTCTLGRLVDRFREPSRLQDFYRQRCAHLSQIARLLQKARLHLQEALPSGPAKSDGPPSRAWEALTETLTELQEALKSLEETWEATSLERLAERLDPVTDQAAEAPPVNAPAPGPVELQPAPAPETINLTPEVEPEEEPRPAWATA
jgi:hypothetical protein